MVPKDPEMTLLIFNLEHSELKLNIVFGFIPQHQRFLVPLHQFVLIRPFIIPRFVATIFFWLFSHVVHN